MVSMQLAVVALALSGASDTMLLDFQASWCGPCRAMEPVVAELASAGYPVRKVDIDREGELARQFGIHSVPCFVLVSGGKEVSRITGATSLPELQSLCAKAATNADPLSTPRVRFQEPDLPLRQVSLPRLRRGAGGRAGRGAAPEPVIETSLGAPTPAGEAASARAGTAVSPDQLIQASARLKIEDETGNSYGTGTIIDARQGEALILSCGHIFRDSRGKGKIIVDLCGPNAPQGLVGRLVAYDLKRDVALLSVRPGAPVTVARVAPKGHRLAPGDRVISVGCNNGGPATAVTSQITSLDKFAGPANLQVAGQPVQGRSGGGLFTPDGLVIGVCNAADPTDNAGLYAALASIQSQLDEAGLTAIYEPQGEENTALASATRPAGSMPPAPRPPVSMMATDGFATRSAAVAAAPPSSTARQANGADQPLSRDEQATLDEIRARSGGAEVICIVRPLADPNGRSEIITLDRASAAFLKQLALEKDTHAQRRLTSLEVSRSPASHVPQADGVPGSRTNNSWTADPAGVVTSPR